MLINYGSCIIYFNQNTSELCTLVINAVPSTASIELTAPGYQQFNNTITVPANTSVNCSVYDPDYVPYTSDITVTTHIQEETITLESGVLCTINPNPSDAKVVFTINGIDYENITACHVPANQSFTYTVSKEGYKPQSVTTTISQATTFNVVLEQLNPYDLSNYTYNLDENYDAVLESYTGNDPDVTVP